MIPRHWLWWVAACTVFSQCEGYGAPTEFEVDPETTLRFTIGGLSPNTTIIIRNYDTEDSAQTNIVTVWMCGKCLANIEIPSSRGYYSHSPAVPAGPSSGGQEGCPTYKVDDSRRPQAVMEFFRGIYRDSLQFRHKPGTPTLDIDCDTHEVVVKPIHTKIALYITCERSGIYTRRGWIEFDEGFLRVAHPTDQILFCRSNDNSDIQHPLILHYSDSQQPKRIGNDLVKLCGEVKAWQWKRFDLKLDHPNKYDRYTVNGNFSDGKEIDEFTNLKVMVDPITMEFVKQGITWRADYCYGGVTVSFWVMFGFLLFVAAFAACLVYLRHDTKDCGEEPAGPNYEAEMDLRLAAYQKFLDEEKRFKDAKKEQKRLAKLQKLEEKEKAKLQKQQEKEQAISSV